MLDYRDRRKNIKPMLRAAQSLRVLCAVSFWMQDELQTDEVPKEAFHDKVQPVLDTVADELKAEEFCENLRDRAGLIANYGPDAYIFRHKSFREYLAGLELVTRGGRDRKCLERIAGQFGEDWWDEPLRFFMGEVDDTLFDQFMDVFFKSDASGYLNQKSHSSLLTMVSEAPQRRIDSLARCLSDGRLRPNKKRYIVDCLKTVGTKSALGVIRTFGEKEAETEAGSYAQEIVAEAMSDVIAAQEVVKVGITDKSFRVHYEYNAEYILIPAGRYRYQGESEKNVPDIHFAKYPVTNRRYRRFIRYLESDEPIVEQILPKGRFDDRIREFFSEIEGLSDYIGNNPADWPGKLRSKYDTQRRFSGEDQPVVGVSWFAARAYCCWLSLLETADYRLPLTKLAGSYRLPTEVEWEWAATGGKREYPWASEKGLPKEKLANYRDNVAATTPVRRYPEGATPEGLMDMAGNVWEWMENWNHKTEGLRSLRGGSWTSPSKDVLRCSFRNGHYPKGNAKHVGFRVVRCQS
jgi:formylglycine-generating enzyme required for sulfatase activity